MSKLSDHTSTWKLTEAKARFSELVREAADAPQRVTVEGKDAVVVVSTALFNQLLPTGTQPDLVSFLENSPLADERLEFGSSSHVMPVSQPASF